MELAYSLYNQVRVRIEGGAFVVPKYVGYTIENDGLMRYNQLMYILINEEVENFILSKSH